MWGAGVNPHGPLRRKPTISMIKNLIKRGQYRSTEKGYKKILNSQIKILPIF